MKKIFLNLLLISFFMSNLNLTAEAYPEILEFQKQIQTKEIIYKEASKKIDYINPSTANNASGAYYPGQRGTNQLIIYTKEYGTRTGTNEFGSEAIVVDGIVVQLYGADSIIPYNGYIISGHGTAKNWINENITVGTKVFVDVKNSILKTYITPDSFIFNANEKIKEVEAIVHYYEKNNVYYDKKITEAYLKKAKQHLKKAPTDSKNVQKYATTAISMANKAIETALPYYPDEFKGIWVRPSETNEKQIETTLDKLEKAGINNIFLETYFHGRTIYPSDVMKKYNLIVQKEDFIGFDPLEVWIREAHKRNIKVHIWFESFYIGNKYNSDCQKNIITLYPHWLNKTRASYDSKEPVPSVSEHNGYFIDPANPEVQKYLLELINEIISKYQPDGINLDYIRYPQSIQEKFNGYENTNWGYTQYAREEFKNIHETDPIDIKKGTPEWTKWAEYRQNKITTFVKEVKNLTNNKNILLTAVIFPDKQRALETKMQDWRSWSINNYIDGVTPLILTCDKQTASLLINDIKKNSSYLTKIYPGLFVTFMGGSTDDLLRQVHETRKLSMNGFIFFDYAHFDDKYIEVLKAGAFNPRNHKNPPKKGFKN